MKKHLPLLAILATTTISCVIATPYQPRNWNGGYYDYQTGTENTYAVGFEGNTSTSASTVREYAHHHAQELCKIKGFSGYKVIKTREDIKHGESTMKRSCSTNESEFSFDVECTKKSGETERSYNVELEITCE